MPYYDFRTLNDRDFELLTQDLLQTELKITLEGFKSGSDQGIDLRDGKNTIVQCKHYYKSGFSKLLSSLKGEKGEFAKAKKLNSTRYILVTSVELSPDNKTKIFKASNGLIKEFGDIIGNEDLNNFLGKYKKIEKKHYKLWLSSTNILQSIFTEEIVKVFNNSIIQSTKNKIIEIQEILPRLVKTEQFNEAQKKLIENKIIFITGEAGCGKSTISEMLFIDLIKQGWQGWFSSEIQEFKNVLSSDDTKEVFFWDDVFGQTYFHLERGFDEGLIQFIKAIKNSKDGYLIINSRTAILNQAKIESEKLKREREFDINQYELEIKNYTQREKAEILYNHCLCSLQIDYFDLIKKDKLYFKIINHHNFSPRLIEFITDQEKFNRIEIKTEDYTTWLTNNLDNPKEVWSDYFDKLSPWSKDYLKICYTFNTKDEDLINDTFKKFLSLRNYEKTNLVNKAIKELTGSFLKRYYIIEEAFCIIP